MTGWLTVDPPLLMAAAFAGAALLALILCALVMRMGVSDAPDGVRKTHSAPVPTSGGLGVAAACLTAGFAAMMGGDISPDSGLLLVSSAACAALALGLIDDAFTVRAQWKLLAMAVIAIAAVRLGVHVERVVLWPDAMWRLPVLLSGPGAVLWLVAMMNAVNFMDGANGLAKGMSLVAAIGFAVLGGIAGAWDIAIMALALAGALAGFLAWNIPGKLFAGDAGALFTGMALGGLSLLLIQARPEWVWLPPLLLLPILTDVMLTLLWRARFNKPLFSAHRDHVYQIALKAGLKHWQVAAIHVVASVNAAAVAIVCAIVGGWFPLAGFVLMLAVAVWVHIRVRRSGERAGLVGRDVA